MADNHPATQPETPDIPELLRRMAQNDPEATRLMCEATNTPVPDFAQRPVESGLMEQQPELPFDPPLSGRPKNPTCH